MEFEDLILIEKRNILDKITICWLFLTIFKTGIPYNTYGPVPTIYSITNCNRSLLKWNDPTIEFIALKRLIVFKNKSILRLVITFFKNYGVLSKSTTVENTYWRIHAQTHWKREIVLCRNHSLSKTITVEIHWRNHSLSKSITVGIP